MRPFLIIVHSIWNSLYKTRYFKEFPQFCVQNKSSRTRASVTCEIYKWKWSLKCTLFVSYVKTWVLPNGTMNNWCCKIANNIAQNKALWDIDKMGIRLDGKLRVVGQHEAVKFVVNTIWTTFHLTIFYENMSPFSKRIFRWKYTPIDCICFFAKAKHWKMFMFASLELNSYKILKRISFTLKIKLLSVFLNETIFKFSKI